MSSKNIHVRIKHHKESQIFPATGAIFPKTPQGDIFCSFFVDHHSIPTESELRMNFDDNTAHDYAKIEDEITREIMVSVIMSPQAAKVIGEGLISLSNSECR